MSENQQENKPQAPDLEKAFALLQGEQNALQKELEEKSGGVITVDDTLERVKRSEQIAVEGKRRGGTFKPTPGVSKFMAHKNAIYKAQGKIPPYSDDCLKATLARELGVL